LQIRTALQSPALAVESILTFRAVGHTRVRGAIVFVQFSARNLTLLLPFLSTNRPPWRKKSILAKIGFGAKRAYFVNAGKMNFY